MRHHLTEIQNPPIAIGQTVRLVEDGDQSEIYFVVGVKYNYRGGAASFGWDIAIATKDEIEKGGGGADGFGMEHLTFT